MTLDPNVQHRAGRMMKALLDSENKDAKMLVTVQVTKAEGASAFHDTFQLRKWQGRSGDVLFVSLPDTADWNAVPPVKPVTPVSVNLRTGQTREERTDPRVDDLVRYAANAALRFALTGKTPTPPNGSVKIIEQSLCGACGRPLSDPESIQRGIGPDCEMQRTGVPRKKRSRKMTTRAARRAGQSEIDG